MLFIKYYYFDSFVMNFKRILFCESTKYKYFRGIANEKSDFCPNRSNSWRQYRFELVKSGEGGFRNIWMSMAMSIPMLLGRMRHLNFYYAIGAHAAIRVNQEEI